LVRPPLQLPDDVRCLVPDLLGHGTRIAHAKASERGPGWSLSEYAADVDVFMLAAGVGPAEKVTARWPATRSAGRRWHRANVRGGVWYGEV
jgi:pimeloyl-ACP methyl ester carboxylesterase